MRTSFGRFSGGSFLAKLCLCLTISMLAVSACTQYRPLGQGSRVPWAEAFAKGQGGPIGPNRYRVAEGDALSLIAERYGVRLAALAAVNNIESPYILYPGEVLRIPAVREVRQEPPSRPVSPSIEQAELSEPRGEPASPTPRPQPRTRTDNRKPEGKAYVVGPGDSLSVIADRNGLRLGELVAANGLEAPYRIVPGQKLVIPPTESERRRQASARETIGSEPAPPLVPPPPLSAGGFLWPVRGEVISSFQQNKATGRSGGINIAARRGEPVRAADNGVVAYAGEALRGYGQMVMLRHAEGYVTLYAHNDALLVREGDVVRRGQVIAEVGSSGDVGSSQLHFELRKGTEPVDPVKLLASLPGRDLGGVDVAGLMPVTALPSATTRR